MTERKKSTSKAASSTRAKSSKRIKKEDEPKIANKPKRLSLKAKSERSKKSPETEGIFYKVFSNTTFRNKPALESPSIQGRLKTTYLINEVTKANPEMLEIGYGILIFDDLAKAKSWGSQNSDIWKVRVGKVFECPPKRIHRNAYYRVSERDDEGKAFTDKKVSWKTIATRLLKLADVVNSWPVGSKMVDWIIPVEKVSRY